MPVEHWGNNSGDPGSQWNEDWVSNPAHTNILKVNDVNEDNDDNDDKIAIHAINQSTNADARALKIEGIAEFLGST